MAEDAGIKRQRSSEDAAPPLLTDCMIPIWECLPSSELIRFISNSVAVLGPFWSFGPRYVLSTRLPLSVKPPQKTGSDAYYYLSDATDAKVASVKQPTLFRHSPLCALIEIADMPSFKIRSFREFGQRCFLDIDLCSLKDIYSPLANVSALTLRGDQWGGLYRADRDVPFTFASFLDAFPQMLQRLKSFKFSDSEGSDHLMPHRLAPGFQEQIIALLCHMANLESLDLPTALFNRAILEAANGHETQAISLSGVFARLKALKIVRNCDHETLSARTLELVGSICASLTELSLQMAGSAGPYLDVFRSLPRLRSVGLVLHSCELTVNESDVAVPLVTELRVNLADYVNDATLLAVLTRFPGVRSLSVRTSFVRLRVILEWSCGRRVLPNLRSLSLFSFCGEHFAPADLVPILHSKHLPEVLDLSRSPFLYISSAHSLNDIFAAMLSNSVERLLLKYHGHFSESDLTNYNERSNEHFGRLLTWAERIPQIMQMCPAEKGMSDFKLRLACTHRPLHLQISGVKSSGPAKGTSFVVQMCPKETPNSASVFD